MGLERINTLTLLIDVRRVTEKLGRPPTITEYDDLGNHSTKTIYRRFDSWDDSLLAAGLDPTDKRDLRNNSRVPTESLIDELHVAASALERPPTTKEMDEIGICSSTVFVRRFGSWDNALWAADLPTQKSRQYSNEELLESVIQLADELGHMPSTSEYDSHGVFALSAVCDNFGSWTEVTATIRKHHDDI